MRWEDERYVRVYTRDTTEWISLSWEARAVFYELLRKVDRCGFIAVGKTGLRGLAALLRMPPEVVQRGIEGGDGLLVDGCVVAIKEGLCLPNFIEAQESKQSDRQRKAEQRSRDRDLRLASGDADKPGHPVTICDQSGQAVTICDQPGQVVTIGHETSHFSDNESRNVTESHDWSQAVTDGHSWSLRAVPCCAVPSSREDQRRDLSEKTPEGPPDPGGSVTEPEESKPSGPAQQVFDAYVTGWRRARGKGAAPAMTPKRRALIVARLKEHDLDTVVAAARGIWLDPWHRDDTNFKHVTPDLAMRDAAHVEKYAAFGAAREAREPYVEQTPRPPAWRQDSDAAATSDPVITNIGDLHAMLPWAQEPSEARPGEST